MHGILAQLSTQEDTLQPQQVTLQLHQLQLGNRLQIKMIKKGSNNNTNKQRPQQILSKSFPTH